MVRYFLNADVDCFFIFDPAHEYEERLLTRAARTQAECDQASLDGFCVFDPSEMFPGQPMAAFEWFVAYVWARSEQLTGDKILFVDEIWKYCSPQKIPLELTTIAVEGRKRGVGLFVCAQRPNKINEAILNELTELICFRLRGKRALEFLPDYSDLDPEEVSRLPVLHFVAENSENGAVLRGQIVFDQTPPAPRE